MLNGSIKQSDIQEEMDPVEEMELDTGKDEVIKVDDFDQRQERDGLVVQDVSSSFIHSFINTIVVEKI